MGVVPRAVLAASIAAVSAALPAGAQVPPGAWPRCISERDGQRLALGGSVCECRYERGGTMIGKPPGWRWSCDIMKMDESVLGIPPDTGRRGLPPNFTYIPPPGASQPGASQPGVPNAVPGEVPNPYGFGPVPTPYGVPYGVPATPYGVPYGAPGFPADIGPRGPAPLLGYPPLR